MKNSIITVITVLVIFYLAGSFISVSFNISNWNAILRVVVASFGLLFGFAFNDINNKK